VIVNVVVADETMQVMAGASETLAQVGAKFGASPAQMAAANPKLDPSKPLPEGKPVKVPTGGAGQQPPGGGGGSGPGAGSVPFFINWELKLNGQVDKSYCYLSDGSGTWDKVPQLPFQFFGGLKNLYTQVFDVAPPSAATIQAQCWGWLGGVLKYLGQGETKVTNEGPIQVIGEGFQLTGLPKWPEGKEEKFLGGGGPTVPPPFALRESKDAADCTAHAAPIVGPFICNTLMNAQVKEYLVLEWEWQPGLPAPDKNWANAIEGYEIYEIIPDTEAPPKFLKEVKPMGAKAAAVPLPWHNYCYGVKAFANVPAYGGKLVSEMSTYCAGQTPAVKSVFVTPSHWTTAGGTWMDVGDCDGYGGADAYVLKNQTGFGNQAGQVLVGSYIVDDEDADCYREGNYAGGIKFEKLSLPTGAVVQKAVLTFSKVFLEYNATGISLGATPSSCVASVGKSKQDWTGTVTVGHASGANLTSAAFFSPGVSLSQYMAPSADVTSTVAGWSKNPATNHGFILVAVPAPHPSGDGTGECLSGLGNFKLDISYFAP
jgi:hypothetical protein